MATAVEPGSEPRAPSTPMNLSFASLIGAVYVVAAIWGVFYVLPMVWHEQVTPYTRNSLVDGALRILVQLACAVGLTAFGRKLLGESPPKGVRGGIFLVLLTSTLVFLLWRFVALNVEGTPGMIFSSVVGVFLLYLAVRFLTGKRGGAWMTSLEEQGWFHAKPYKRSLGQKVRRLTALGILLIGGTGILSLTFQGVLPTDWVLTMPFDLDPITVLPDANNTVPILIALLTGWIAYRAMNVPSFTEFLIATEAEMNKVSWTTKRRLAQDTVVVLTTTLLMALFLLVVDLFWGWLLSRQIVGVLPPKATAPDKGAAAQQAKW